MPLRRRFAPLALAVLLASVAGPAPAEWLFAQGQGPRPGVASPADPARGAAIAQRWCATCHVTAVDQTQATGEATPFPSIARRNTFDAAALALFLLDPHPRMPDMNLTRAEAADLAAYVRSLAPK
ncbi:c-type cytochrome [Rhodoplanes sp. TEM]|uniref:C-type cytochrome n=1 Tax=Rhodoplanes tepidamans TaxID=200616 RepID=A0ABT5JF18_RHOTP|nr:MULTISPECIES: c-type cytochrome [Rhodoplanes]MDC7788295.1 c-type cytochrome [Rhodoplanes tepidamans]MDC7986225.1 c-type cytochrome [Rhodoplanes sp. TEM]MDQ0355652.1 mono/diheme cytochrome c family protein [Rhodoplanes tepidamans]